VSNTHHKAVIRYYEETDWDHRFVWHRGIYQAAHFGIYDETARDHESALLNTNEIMSRLAGITPGMQVLDAGCGWGGSALWLARHKHVTVTGVNITGYQVTECRDKAKKNGLQHACTFIESDYCDTPFADEQFDVVWSCESLCHTPNKEAFYREAHRVLKPGGRLIIADYQRRKRPLSNDEEALLHQWLAGWASLDIDTPEEHLKHASLAGFATVHFHDYSRQVEVSLHNLYTHAVRWSWLGTIGRSLRLLKACRVRNVKGTKAMYQAYQKGLWRYTISVCSKSEGIIRSNGTSSH
jgi:tocopherol O-methyltransferase